MLFFLYFFHVQPIEKWRRKMSKMTYFRFFKLFIAILRQNDASYEKTSWKVFVLQWPKKPKKTSCDPKNWNFHNLFINCYKQIGCCWILTFNFLPLFIDINIYRLKQVSRCGMKWPKMFRNRSPIYFKNNSKTFQQYLIMSASQKHSPKGITRHFFKKT